MFQNRIGAADDHIKLHMKNQVLFRWPSLCLAIVFFLTGCANTIPSRVQNAPLLHPTAVYPVKVAFVTLSDERPLAEKESPKRVSWPKGRGQVDYYGELTEHGLTDAISDYLTASRLFNQVIRVDSISTDATLKQLGYRAVMRGKIKQFHGGYSVPVLILGFALMPNPLFFILPGITLLPMVLWPKKVIFDVEIDEMNLKDLNTSEEIWSGKVEIEQEFKKTTTHIAPKWYLGELVEKISKDLIQQLSNSKLKF